jgi:ribosomal protein L7Ae-like RNA K-turn-binding protein
MKLALGETTIGILADMGLAEQTTVDAAVMNSITDGSIQVEPGVSTNFIKISSKLTDRGMPEPSQESQALIDMVRHSDKVITTLFDIESYQKDVSFEPITTVAQNIKNTTQTVSKTQKSALKKMQDVEQVMLEQELQLFNALGEDTTMNLLGAVEDVKSLPITKRKKQLGKNLAIEREVKNVAKFIELMPNPDSSFYYNWEVWKNLRMGLASSLMNPQASKVHRFLTGAKSWKTTVKLNDINKIAYFKVAVAQSFGKDIDKQTTEETIAQFDQIIADETVQKALNSINKLQSGKELTVVGKQNILDAIGVGGEDIHTMAGLVALNAYDNAAPNGVLEENFNTTLALETDGITNGVIIGLLQSMLEENSVDMLESGGIYTDGKTTDFGGWIDGVTNIDSYQRLSVTWSELFDTDTGLDLQQKKFIKSVTGQLTEVVDGKITATSTGRKLAKLPLMTSNYGATIKKIVDLFGDDALERLYDRMYAAENQAELDIVFNELSQHNNASIAAPDINELHEYTLPAPVIKKFKKGIAATMGVALEMAIGQQFKGFSEYRNALNDSFKLMFTVFKVKYDEAITIAEKDKGTSLTESEKADVATSLRQFMPAIATAISVKESDKLVIMKTIKTRNYENKNHSVQVKFARPLEGTETLSGKKSSSMKGTIAKHDYTDGGVAGGVLSTQAIDASIMVHMMENFESLNVHDATISGLDTVVDTTREYSKEFLEVNQRYSVLESTVEALNKVLLAADGSVNLDSVLEDTTLAEFLTELDATAEKVKTNRDEYFPTVTASSQAALDGAGYVIERPTTIKDLRVEELDHVEQAIKDMLRPLGSQGAAFDFDTFQAAYEVGLTSDNTLTTFENLQSSFAGDVKDSPTQVEHLRGVIDGLVNKVISEADAAPVSLGINVKGTEVLGQISDGIIQIQAGRSNSIENTSQLSTQEVFTHELVHHVTDFALQTDFTYRTQIEHLRTQIRSHTKVEDFMPQEVAVSIAEDYKAAKKRYDYIFSGKDSLQEFVAFGVTNEAIRKKLAAIPATPTRDLTSGSLWDRLQELWNAILDFVQGKLYGTENVMADQALDLLVSKLVDTNKRYHESIRNRMGFVGQLDKKTIAALNKHVYAPLHQYYKSLRKKDKLSKLERGVKTLVGVPFILRNKVGKKTLLHALRQVLNLLNITERGFLIKLAREIQGITADNSKWHQLLRLSKMYVDQERRHVAELISKEVFKAYKTTLTDAEANSINQALLKTDVAVLQGKYDLSQVTKLLRSEDYRNKEISKLQNQLRGFNDTKGKGSGNYYIRQAMNLGEIMATGISVEENPMLNAYNIVQMRNVEQIATGDLKLAEELVDQLASLSAIQHTDQEINVRAAGVVSREYKGDPKANGVLYTLETHENFKKESLEKLFHGNKSQVQKGYTSEITNPNIEVRMGLDNKETEAEMKKLGFKKEGSLIKDQKDKNTAPMAMYITRYAAQNTYLKTTVSLTNKIAKGTDIMESLRVTGTRASNVERIVAMQHLAKTKYSSVQDQFASSQRRTKQSNNNILVPVVDENGNITSYRYMMTEATKTNLLEKNNKFDIILGRMQASIHDKLKSADVNKEVINLAHKEYVDGYSKNPGSFVEIGPKAENPRYREIYSMMPKDMKREMHAAWGDDTIQVKEELIDLIFGYRKLSFADINVPFTQVKVFDGIDKVLPGAKQFTRAVERGIQEFVSIAKDNIVIKSGIVLWDNVASNNVVLMVKGVNPKHIAKDSALAYNALKQYQEEVSKRDAVQHKLDISKGLSAIARKNLTKQIESYNDSLAANPVRELIKEGIFQSIVEDIEINADDYSYRGKFGNYIQGLTGKITDSKEGVADIAQGATWTYKQAYMTKDTLVYQQLLQFTQKSDFVARFVLYQHYLRNIDRKHAKKALTKEQIVAERQKALLDVIETFVNYDIPTSPAIQYLNDIGVLMFTKFLFRIQKVIVRTFRENPANTMALYALENAVGDLATIDDSFLPWSNLMEKFNMPISGVWDPATQISAAELWL